MQTFFFRYRWSIGALCIVIAVVAIWARTKGLAFQPNVLGKAIDLVAGLSVVVLLVERSLAVLNNIWYGEERQKNEERIGQLERREAAVRTERERVQATREALAKRPIPTTEAAASQDGLEMARQTHAELETLRTEDERVTESLESALGELSAVEAKQARLRLQLGFLFALAVSAAGVRSLEPLFLAKGADGLVGLLDLGGFQLGAFRAADMLLTAGLIAGGSAGLNLISEMLGTYVQASRKRAQS